MKVYFTEKFKEILKSPDRYIEIGKFRLGSYSQSVKKLSDIDWRYMNQRDSGRSPTDGYYQFSSILSDSVLTLNMEIPSYDIGLLNEEYYKLVYAVYTDLMTSENGIAFILCGDTFFNSESMLEILPLRLSRDKNIITVSNFNPQCLIKLSSDEDTQFLEGPGLGKYYNIYSAPEIGETEKDTRYVSLLSYDSYLLEKKSQDDYDHLETIFINKFGIKIY